MPDLITRHYNRKKLKALHAGLRAVVQLLFFIFLPSAFTAAWGGIKNACSQVGLHALIEQTAFVKVLLFLCLYTMLFGRFFCGYACAFGSIGDALHAVYLKICRKMKRRPLKLPGRLAAMMSLIKYLILALAVVLCCLGMYGQLKGTSPWDIFSMLRAGNPRFEGYRAGLVIFILLLIGMFFCERFFCRFFCPMGAVFSLLPVLPLFSLQRDRKECLKGCSACTRMCPSDIELPASFSAAVRGDCFQCQKCIETCPQGNVHCGFKWLRGNEMWFTILRAVVLALLLHLSGI